MDILLISLIAILAVFLVAIIFIFSSERKGKVKDQMEKLEMSLFLVLMPKHDVTREGETPEGEKNLIARMEQVFTNFLFLDKKKNQCVVFEIASQIGSSDISFYVAVPRSLDTGLEKYIQGVYPRAIVERVPQDYTVFEAGGTTAASYMKLSQPPFFPINTYNNLEKDPLSALTNTLNKIVPSEGAAVQMLIRPVASSWRALGNKIVEKIQQGKSVKEAITGARQSSFMKAFIEPTAKKGEPIKEKNIDHIGLDAIQSKIKKQAFETNIRLVASAQSAQRAEDILSHLEGAFGQFSLSSVNSLEPKRVIGKELKRFVFDFSFRNFVDKQINILNIEELASIYHFPSKFTETPYIKAAKTMAAAPPTDLPKEGTVLIGKAPFRGEVNNVYFASKNDRARHFYVVGQTGTGKSSLLREMIRQDILNGEGVAVIDPHGDLVESTLANIPKNRVEDVILFEPSDMERPVGLNMLEFDSPEQKDFVIQEMIAIFQKLFPPEMIGPMFEHYMRNAMLAVGADKENPGTLVEIPRMFTDPAYMEEKLKKVTDKVVRDFWQKEWKQTTGSTRSDMLGYVVSKIGRFIENEMMRNIIGQTHSGFDLGKIMDEGKIFLANLSKGMTGEVNSSLLGLILVSKMQMAAMRRARIPEEQRKDFYLYIDEFQNFTTDSISTILSEARKYKLNLTLAHQYIPQLTNEIKNAVVGNVGTIASFRVGPDDAEFLEKQFKPEFSKYDLVNLDNFNMILKMMINNKISSPFRIEIVLPKEGRKEMVEPIKKLSNMKYGRDRAEVEADIIKRSQFGVEKTT